jgi:hypothetical protein
MAKRRVRAAKATPRAVEAPAVAIAQLLQESLAAHAEYRANMARMAPQGGVLVAVPGNPIVARAALERAGDLRRQAHDADPNQADPAWALDPIPHHDLLTFYAEQLAR